MIVDRVFRRMIVAAVLATALAGPGLAGHSEPYVDGDELTFAFLDLDGRIVRSTDPVFQGKVLLIDLWATWCPPCVGEVPTLIDLQDRLAERELERELVDLLEAPALNRGRSASPRKDSP